MYICLKLLAEIMKLISQIRYDFSTNILSSYHPKPVFSKHRFQSRWENEMVSATTGAIDFSQLLKIYL